MAICSSVRPSTEKDLCAQYGDSTRIQQSKVQKHPPFEAYRRESKRPLCLHTESCRSTRRWWVCWARCISIHANHLSSASSEWQSLSGSRAAFHTAQNAVLIWFSCVGFYSFVQNDEERRKRRRICLRHPLKTWGTVAEWASRVRNRDQLWLWHDILKTSTSADTQRPLDHLAVG